MSKHPHIAFESASVHLTRLTLPKTINFQSQNLAGSTFIPPLEIQLTLTLPVTYGNSR